MTVFLDVWVGEIFAHLFVCFCGGRIIMKIRTLKTTTPGFNYLSFSFFLPKNVDGARVVCRSTATYKNFSWETTISMLTSVIILKYSSFLPLYLYFSTWNMCRTFTTVCLFKWWKARWISWKLFPTFTENEHAQAKIIVILQTKLH